MDAISASLPTKPTVLIVLTTLLIFAFDAWSPLGTCMGILYVLSVVATVPHHNRRLTLIVAAITSILIAIGYWISPTSPELEKAQLNRLLSLATVWISTWVVLCAIRSTLALHNLQEDLERRIEQATVELQNKHRATLNLLQDVEHAKDEITKKEQQFHQVIEASPSGLILVDENGTIILTNHVLEKQFGYDRGELLEQPIEHLLPERFRARHPSYRNDFFDNPEPRPMGGIRDLYGLRKDGTEFPVEIGLNPLTTKEGLFVLASVVDITLRKQEETILRQYMDELQRSNQELDDFAYIASHDLKEPLRGIYNYSTILLEDYGNQLNSEARSRCDTLIRPSRRMESLIDSLLYYSRAGRTDLAKGSTNLQHILDEILDSLDIRLKECGVRVIIPRPLPTVSCDRIRVGEIFRNLITNAMKYNDKPDKWIEIGYGPASEVAGNGTGPSAAPGEALGESLQTQDEPLVFYVRDNGIGIQEKHLERIFRIFKRLHGRDKFHGGTGAGLTITKKLVERHGGRLWVDSLHGEGSTFFFTLQRSVSDGIHTATAHSAG